jgi:hypothetical protein
MASYESQLVHDILAAGDLTTLDKLIQALFGELGSKIPTVRNPRRLNWFRQWRESLSRIGELPRPRLSAVDGVRVGVQEVDLLAKRVVASGNPCAVEELLHSIANELTLTAVIEADPERRVWMSQAGCILNLNVVEAESSPDLEELADVVSQPEIRLGQHVVMRAMAIALVSLFAICLLAPVWLKR